MHKISPKALLVVAATGMVATAACAQTPIPAEMTAEKCFVEAPPEVFQLIVPNTRLDMVDYFKAGMDRKSANAAGGECVLLSVEPQSVMLQAGDGILCQFFVLEGSKKPLIGVIETLSTPGEDSSMKFYTSDWVPVDAKKGIFRQPTLSDWANGDKATIAQAQEQLPFILVSYSYDPNTQTLTATNNMASYYHPTDTPDSLGKLRQTITYKWDARRDAFVKEKK